MELEIFKEKLSSFIDVYFEKLDRVFGRVNLC